MVAADILYEGAAVGEDGNGYARPLQAGDVFLGFAAFHTDNSDGAAGAKLVTTLTAGRVSVPVTGVTIADNARTAVYASDDDTFTTTAGGNSLIGYVSRVEAAGKAVVEFDAALVRAALQA
jgi:hypothetical protein